jgi:hypothetical protein
MGNQEKLGHLHKCWGPKARLENNFEESSRRVHARPVHEGHSK